MSQITQFSSGGGGGGGTNTLTGNSGVATQSANNINTPGAQGIFTTGSGATLTIAYLPLTDVTGTTQAMAVNNGYTANNAGLVTLTLPATAVYGSMLMVIGKGAGLFAIAQNAGQTIHFVSSSTTVGVGGSLTAVEQYATITLRCTVADTTWTIVGSAGNFTIV